MLVRRSLFDAIVARLKRDSTAPCLSRSAAFGRQPFSHRADGVLGMDRTRNERGGKREERAPRGRPPFRIRSPIKRSYSNSALMEPHVGDSAGIGLHRPGQELVLK